MKCARHRAPVVLLAAFLLATGAVSTAIATGSAHSPALVDVQVSHDAFAAHSEPYVAENPRNPSVLVAGSKFFTDPAHYLFKIGTFFSTNGGQSWTDAGLLPGFAAYRLVSDVTFAFSPNGSLAYACVIAVNGLSTGVFVSRSRDGGRSWGAPATVFLDTQGIYFNDKPWIAVDSTRGAHRGAVYVAWNLDEGDRAGKGSNRPVTGIAVSRSSDYGKTFSPPVVVSRFDTQHFAIGATPQVTPNGRLSIAFLAMIGTGKQTREAMDLVSSADGGITFSAPRAIVPAVVGLPNHLSHGIFRNLSLPAFAVSPSTGSMMIAWADLRNGDADILKSSSFDGGQTWSVPARVNHDRIHDGKDQFQPALAVAPDGVYACAWFDRRFDPADRLIDVEVAQSHNDGRTFGKNRRITTHSWDSAIDAPRPDGPNKRVTFIGDYQGIAADNLTVHPLWNDTQNGRTQEIRTAAVPAG
ncbi:MAG: glycoside hydrolase [Chloroflexota bacterium]|nr:glycoside hydrolase [Chloroflexota bacterium]